MNGNLFKNLKRLTRVFLSLNPCINENFLDQSRIALMPKIVDEKCGFEELLKIEIDPIKVLEDSLLKNATVMVEKYKTDAAEKAKELENEQKTNEKLNAELKEEKEKLKALSVQLELVKSEADQKVSGNATMIKELEVTIKYQEILGNKTLKEIEELRSTISEQKSDKKHCQNQLNFMQDNQSKLEKQWNEICTLKVEVNQKTLEFKLKENEELTNKLERQDLEIIEKNDAIKKLKKKVEVCF